MKAPTKEFFFRKCVDQSPCKILTLWHAEIHYTQALAKRIINNATQQVTSDICSFQKYLKNILTSVVIV